MRQNKKDYFETLDMKSVTDNKMFWKTVAPLFSNKSKASNKITLSENEKLITNDQKSAEVFNNYFNSIVEELNIPIDQNLLNDASLFDDPIIAAIHKYKTDLSKAFDCIVHDFLIAKLEAYGFSYEALKVIYNYLTDRKHRTKVNNSFSDFIDLLLGVPQGSILGPLLFNIYICDLFFFVEEDNVTSYADDTTPYSNGKNVVTVLENIETKGKEVFS